MEKPQTELDWHKLHRFDELPKAQQQAVVRLVNTLASYHRNAEMNNQQLADLISEEMYSLTELNKEFGKPNVE